MLFRFAVLFAALTLFAEDWTRFRGLNGAGVADGAGFPAELGKDRNLIWRTSVRPGKSSPVLTRDRIFISGFERGKLFTQCFDRESGKLLWERDELRPRDPIANKLNHPAAITPVTDGENVYVFFKDLGVVSYDRNGKPRWKAATGPFNDTMGLGASPILTDDSVVIVVDQMQGSYIAAFEKRSGEMRWKTGRDETESWGTAIFYQPEGMKPFVITASRGQVGVHDAADGKRVATLKGISTTIVGSPLIHGDTIYVFGYGSDNFTPFTGSLTRFDKNKDGRITRDEYENDPIMNSIASNLGNRDGIVTEDEWTLWQQKVQGPTSLTAVRLERDGQTLKPRELWRYEKGFAGVIPSALLYKGVVYVVKNGGVLMAFDADTGRELKTGRLAGAISGYSSSPVAADGKIYICSEDGHVVVLRPGKDWEVEKVNDLGEGIFATPALSGGHIYLRTEQALYRFGTATK